MEKKYVLTNDIIVISSHVLHRIQATKNFGNVKAGDLGGYVEKECNLSHEGTCWVYGNARVYENARVSGKACIDGEACVFGSAIVDDKAYVFGKARVYEEAHVFGKACIYSEAYVYGEAHVYGAALVHGKARVYGEAQVCDGVCVCGTAQIHGKARVYGEARIYGEANISNQYTMLCVTNIGSRDDATTFFIAKNGEIYVSCGCFRGTIEEFEKAVEETHSNSKHGLVYKSAIQMAKLALA